MKKLLLLLVFPVIAFSQNYDPDDFNVKTDEFTGVTQYVHEDVSSRDLFLPYIIKQNEVLYLQLQIDLTSNDWVFFNKVMLKFGSSIVTIPNLEPEREVKDGHIREWTIIEITPELMVNFLSNTEVKYRFQGKRDYDGEITKSELKRIQQTIYYYQTLKHNAQGIEGK